jgi:hypothetical protein
MWKLIDGIGLDLYNCGTSDVFILRRCVQQNQFCMNLLQQNPNNQYVDMRVILFNTPHNFSSNASSSCIVTPRVTKTLNKVINKWLGAVTRLNQKANFKNKVSDSNYREINPNFFFKWNSKFWSFFGKNLFFLAIRCNKDHASQISSKSRVLKNFGEFLSKFNS